MKMKCSIIAILGLLMLSMEIETASAQQRSVGKFEFEVSGGAVFPIIDPDEGVAGEPGFQIGGELRRNINPSLDVGIRYSFSIFHRYVPSVVSHQINTATFMATIDYNWRPTERLNFFIGAGAGLNSPLDSWQNLSPSSGYGLPRYYNPVVSPRVGVELFNWLRLTSEYRITKRRYSYYALTLGYVFGGRPR